MSDDVRCFAERSSDGMDDVIACDGVTHFTVMMPDHMNDEGAHVTRTKPCDGSCRPLDLKAKLLAQIEKLRTEAMQDGVQTLKTRIKISSRAQALLESGSIEGVLVSSSYAKRSGEEYTYCLTGGAHLKITVNFDWWSGEKTGFYQTVNVGVQSCKNDFQHEQLDSAETLEHVQQAIKSHTERREDA